MICGGGHLPAEVIDHFMKLAGGTAARLVVITTASETADSSAVEEYLESWRKQAVRSLQVLHTRDRSIANGKAFAKPLEKATGVWFIGGDQSKLTDAYLGTRTEKQLRGVLARGGVIGGTSAGAAIMSPVMIRSGEFLTLVGRGFGFLPGTVVDQHFLVRHRQERLMRVLSEHTGLVGLGIDEGTALVVDKDRVSVMGSSRVVACMPACANCPAKIQYLEPGCEVDLKQLELAASAPRSPLLNVVSAEHKVPLAADPVKPQLAASAASGGGE